MKSVQFALLMLATLSSRATAMPQSANREAAALRAIHVNCEAVRHDAAIYQWARVNREVDRIVGDHKRVQAGLAAEKAPALQSAMDELRAARLARDPKRLDVAAGNVDKLVGELLKR